MSRLLPHNSHRRLLCYRSGHLETAPTQTIANSTPLTGREEGQHADFSIMPRLYVLRAALRSRDENFHHPRRSRRTEASRADR